MMQKNIPKIESILDLKTTDFTEKISFNLC
jgi:hypothetical protein